MWSFPRFLTLLLAFFCGGASGFAPQAVKFATTTHTPSFSAAVGGAGTPGTAAINRIMPPLIQAASVAVEPTNGSPLKESLKNGFRKYIKLSEEKPLITKGVSAAVVGGIGDVFSQSLFAFATGAVFQWDALRTASFMLMGLCFKGPALHLWYGVLGRISHWTKVRRGFSETGQTLTALTVDQTVGVAIFYPLYFIVFEVCSCIFAKRLPNLLALQSKMAATLFPVVLAQYYVWPLANFLSFKYCPASLRVLYADGISVFWNCFLCARLAA